MGPPAFTDSVMHSEHVAKVVGHMKTFVPNKMYDPKTASTILSMASIQDIRDKKSNSHPDVRLRNPMYLFADQAWHGGGWNSPYTQDSRGKGAYIIYVYKEWTPYVIAAVLMVFYLIWLFWKIIYELVQS